MVDRILGNADDLIGAGRVGAIRAVSLVNSHIAAGMGPGTDGIFGTQDDVTEQEAATSLIDKVLIKAQITGSGHIIGSADDVGMVKVRNQPFAGNNEVRIIADNVPEQDSTAPVISARLANDTGPSTLDRITSDPTITGSIQDASRIVIFQVGLDASTSTQFQELWWVLDTSGNFVLYENNLVDLLRGPLADGTHTLSLSATDALGNASDPVQLVFVIDTAAGRPSLRLSPGRRAVMCRCRWFILGGRSPRTPATRLTSAKPR